MMQRLIALLGLCLSLGAQAEVPAEPVMPHAHIHLTPADLRELDLARAAALASSSQQVGAPVPTFRTMQEAAAAGVQPFAKVAVPDIKIDKPRFVLPRWSLYLAGLVAFVVFVYAWIRLNRRPN